MPTWCCRPRPMRKSGAASPTPTARCRSAALWHRPGEARQDWELIQELANRLGLDWTYKHPKDVFTEMTEAMPSLKHITWDRLVREDAVTYPVDGPDVPGNEILFAEGFPTGDGRAKIVPAGLVPPDELPDEDYPLVLTTGRMLEHRSEEHTSECQSLMRISYAVFCLKKKQYTQTSTI